MKNYKFKINGNEYSVDIVNIEENKAQVEVNGKAYEVEMDMSGIKVPAAPKAAPRVAPVAAAAAPVAAAPAAAPAPAPAASGAGMQVKSPLPGTVLNIMVHEGDTVTAGQHLILLEAMKMENNIDAPKAGKVTNIRVKDRDAVMEGDLLLTIE
jgi:biotin carboxyl carrier protein